MLKSLFFVLLCSVTSFAADKVLPTVEADNVRCEKMRSSSMAKFKESLVENCNLNLPYSASLSTTTLNEDVYFYCCRKK